MIRAAVLPAPERVEIREVAEPDLARNEVLIRPVRSGICGSDVSFYLGHRPAAYPVVLGHEVVGRIARLGEAVSGFAVGQRVVVEPNYPCGACDYCRSGRGRICPNKRIMGVTEPGCFADYTAAPAEFVWAVPDSISDADAATIEPLAVSLHALMNSEARMGDTVAVVGSGAVGLLLIHAAVRQGIRVLAHDRLEAKLALAARLGAETPTVENVAKLWLEERVTTVFECAGAASTAELALAAAPRGSQVVLLGLANSPAAFRPLRIVREDIRIVPSLIYDHPSDFRRSIALVERGVLSPSRVVGEALPFESIGQALELAGTGRFAKIQVLH